MTRLDLTSLYNSYAGRGKVPHRPDLMLVIVLFELRRGQRQPSQWFQDTQENCALWWLGYGIRPSRSCWYEFRDRTGPSLDRLNLHVLHQAVDAELTQVERGALDGSAVAANASRRRLINAERLQQRLHQLEAVRQDDAQGDAPTEVPAWMAKTPRSRTAQHERYLQAQEHLVGLQAANQHYSPSERRAPDKIVVSTGDPRSRFGRGQRPRISSLVHHPNGVLSTRWLVTRRECGYSQTERSDVAMSSPPVLFRTGWGSRNERRIM